jgi:hypothetical protein
MTRKLSDGVDLWVDNIIKEWAFNNLTRIVRAFTQKGGWEGWAQVEIATAIYDHIRAMPYANAKDALLVGTSTVLREVPVYPSTKTVKGYTSQKAADLLIEFGPPSSREFIIIELKCEGFYNKDAFVAAVAEDVSKLNGDIQHHFKPARTWALGFSTSQAIYAKMLQEQPSADHIILYPLERGGPTLTPDQLKTNPMIVLWIFETELLKK